ncbi:hypothetical protein ABZP36_010373, partial [Zizania latifolia]
MPVQRSKPAPMSIQYVAPTVAMASNRPNACPDIQRPTPTTALTPNHATPVALPHHTASTTPVPLPDLNCSLSSPPKCVVPAKVPERTTLLASTKASLLATPWPLHPHWPSLPWALATQLTMPRMVQVALLAAPDAHASRQPRPSRSQPWRAVAAEVGPTNLAAPPHIPVPAPTPTSSIDRIVHRLRNLGLATDGDDPTTATVTAPPDGNERLGDLLDRSWACPNRHFAASSFDEEVLPWERDEESVQGRGQEEGKRSVRCITLGNVVRRERRVLVSIYDVVVGDVVPLKIGDQVPADGVLISGHSLSIDESSMTGESKIVHKDQKSPFLMSGCKVADDYDTML